MQLDLSSGKLRPESLPHHLLSLGTDPSMGNSTGAAASESNKEIMSYSSKDPIASQTLLVTVAQKQKLCFLERHGKACAGELEIPVDPLPCAFSKLNPAQVLLSPGLWLTNHSPCGRRCGSLVTCSHPRLLP